MCTLQELNRVKAIKENQNIQTKWDEVAPFRMSREHRFELPMVALWIAGGRKNKGASG